MTTQSIKAEIRLDPSKGVQEAKQAGTKMAQELALGAKQAAEAAKKERDKERKESIQALNQGLELVKKVGGAISGTIAINEKFSQMREGLTSVLGAAGNATDEIDKLRLLSKNPGLEFESAAKAHKRFLALGQSAEGSRNLIAEIGNALKLSGLPAEGIEQVAAALAQTGEDGKAVVGSLHEMTKESVVFRKAFQAGFGTSSIRELEALHLSSNQFVEGFRNGLQTLQTAQSTASDVAKNARQMYEEAKTNVANSAVEAAGNYITGAKVLGKQIYELFGGKADWSEFKQPAKREGAIDKPDAKGAENLANLREKRLQKIKNEIDLEEDLAAARNRESDLAARIEREPASKAALLKEQYAAQKERTDKIAEELEINKSLLDIMKARALNEAEAIAFIRTRIQGQRELTNAAEKAAKQAKLDEDAKTIAIRKRDNSIAREEASGHTKKAERMKRAAAVEDKTKELELQGMSKPAAEKMAKEEVQTQWDAEYRQRTGRSRSHGARNEKPSHSGIDNGSNYSGLNYLEESHGRIGDNKFARLDLMKQKQDASDRRPVEKSITEAPKASPLEKSNNELRDALNNFGKRLDPLIKKYSASDLNP